MSIVLYKHNAYAYNQVEERLKTSSRTCVIHPTGSGKSFIAIKWLYENRDKKCLFLTSQKPIIDQIIRHIENCGMTLADFPNLSFELYSNVSEDYANNHKADCIVLDEFHRCGAPEWGKNLNSLLDNNKNAKVLGVSATPIRYLDDNRNMAEELFDNNIASEISLVEAVSKGILPLPTYINAIYSFEQNIQEIQNKINKLAYENDRLMLEEQLNKAKRILEKSAGLREVFSKNITKQNGKFIVFCKDLEHMNRMIAESRDWFKDVNPDIDIYSVYSANNDYMNKLAVDSFEQNNSSHLKLLFCVNMLNEGLHVNDIDGVIMLRPTVSPIIYLQQLGRALSVGHNAEPLIFDIVNNSNCISDIKEFYQKVKRNIENGNKNPALDGYKDIELDDFTIVDEMSSVIDLLSSLSKCITKETIEQSKAKKLYDDLLKLGHQPNRNNSKYESSLYTALINHGREWLTEEQLVTLGQYGIYIPQQLSQEDLGLILFDDLMTLGHQPSQNIKEEQNLYGRLASRGEKFLSQEQLEELAKYGIYIPKAITTEERGNQLYEDLIKFGKQPRRTSENLEESNLYSRFQKHGREWLTDEQIKSLLEIGITLPVQKDEKKESEQFFNELIQLGHQPKKSNPEEISLYKKLMRRGPSLLTPEHFEELAKYGIGLPKKLSEEDYVNQTFVDLINLGRLPIPKNSDEKPLYSRVRKWKDKFTLEQKQILTMLGMDLGEEEPISIDSSNLLLYLANEANRHLESGNSELARIYKNLIVHIGDGSSFNNLGTITKPSKK